MHFCRCALMAASMFALTVYSTPSLACDPPEQERIFGGKPTKIEDHPWQVALDIDGELCGGVIIEPNWVLTAAHCFDSDNPNKVRVKTGVTNYKTGGVWSRVDRVVRHKFNPATKENDLALVKLKTPPAGLKIKLGGSDLVLGQCQKLEVTGWGRIKAGGGASAILQKATVAYVDNAICNEPTSYNGRVRSSMMCAGYPGIDACTGDSGGPLVLRRSQAEGGDVLVGIVSWGGENCGKTYGVYARVSTYREWIRGVIAGGK